MNDMAMTHPDPNDPFDVVQARGELDEAGESDELQADNAVEADTIQAVSPEGSPD